MPRALSAHKQRRDLLAGLKHAMRLALDANDYHAASLLAARIERTIAAVERGQRDRKRATTKASAAPVELPRPVVTIGGKA